MKPGIQHIIADLEKELSALEANVQPNWKGLVEPLEHISDRISRAWGTVSHLKVCMGISNFIHSISIFRRAWFRARGHGYMPNIKNAALSSKRGSCKLRGHSH